MFICLSAPPSDVLVCIQMYMQKNLQLCIIHYLPPPPLIIHLPPSLPPLSSYIHHCMTLGWGVGFRILYYNLSGLSN